MASAEAKLLDAIEQKKAQQSRDKAMLAYRSRLYRGQLSDRVLRPEYLVGGICLGLLFARHRRQKACHASRQGGEVNSSKALWQQIAVEVLDRQLSRGLFALRRYYQRISKDTTG